MTTMIAVRVRETRAYVVDRDWYRTLLRCFLLHVDVNFTVTHLLAFVLVPTGTYVDDGTLKYH